MTVNLKEPPGSYQRVEISYKTIIFTVFFLIGLWFLFEIRQIIVGLFISIILMSAINPIVDRLHKMKLSRGAAILLVYFMIFCLFGLVFAIIIPPLIEQTTLFVLKSGTLIRNIDFTGLGIDPDVIVTQVTQLGSIPANVLRLTITIFSNFVELFALMVITFYLLIERKNLNKYLLVLFGEGGEQKAEGFINKVEKILGGWVRGELALMATIGVMTFIGLRLLGIDYALPLAIFSGFLEIVPNIGPVISAVPAVLTGFAVSPIMALAVSALYFLVHQTENGLITPKIMQKVVGVNPLVTILSLAVGFKIGSIAGAVLAVPAVLIIQIVLSEFISSKTPKSL